MSIKFLVLGGGYFGFGGGGGSADFIFMGGGSHFNDRGGEFLGKNKSGQKLICWGGATQSHANASRLS